MNYYFIIKDIKSEKSLILLRLTNGKQSIKISTSVKGNPKYFDMVRYEFTKSEELWRNNNYILAEWKRTTEKIISMAELNKWDIAKTKEELLIAMGKESKSNSSEHILPYFKKWSTTSTTKRVATRQMYYSYTLFEGYCNSIGIVPTFDEVTNKVAEGYIEYMAKRGLNPNTRGCHIKNLKAVMSKSYSEELHTNRSFINFRKERNEVDTIYLTAEEVERLENLPLIGTKALVRNLFIIGCHTAMRYSDYTRLSHLDIIDGVIRQTQQKTGNRVVIPAHPKVVEIINYYGGKLPTISQQKFNSIIKDVCRQANICDKVGVTEVTLGGKETTYYEKWELVSSHTARRTAATNMYKAGIPTLSIMQITGHKTEASFMLYIRVTKEENARNLANNPFFKK